MAVPAASVLRRCSLRASSAHAYSLPSAAPPRPRPASSWARTWRSTTASRRSRQWSSERTGGRGVDVVVDIIGAKYFEQNLAALGKDGRLVIIGTMGGSVVDKFNLGKVQAKRLSIMGSTMRPRSAAEKAAIAADLRAKVWPVLDAGRCAPLVHRGVAAGAGRRSAPPHGKQRSHRQDRAAGGLAIEFRIVAENARLVESQPST